MEKCGQAKPGLTICDYCGNKCVTIDEEGVARCQDHLQNDEKTVKLASDIISE